MNGIGFNVFEDIPKLVLPIAKTRYVMSKCQDIFDFWNHLWSHCVQHLFDGF